MQMPRLRQRQGCESKGTNLLLIIWVGTTSVEKREQYNSQGKPVQLLCSTGPKDRDSATTQHQRVKDISYRKARINNDTCYKTGASLMMR